MELMVPPAAAGHTADGGAKAPGRVDGGERGSSSVFPAERTLSIKCSLISCLCLF